MKNKRTKYHATLGTVSRFTLVCGIIALLYLIYRICLLGFSLSSIDTSFFRPQNGSVVCANDDSEKPTDPQLLVSSAYINNIRAQPALSANLLGNADLMESDPDATNPVGFSRSIESDTASYQYLENEDKSRFLRVIDKREGVPIHDTRPAWLMPNISMQPDLAYAYSFQYRSGVPVELTIESTGLDGKTSYQLETTLPATSVWRTFTAHYSDISQSASFRPVVTTTKPGYVDLKGFDIHQIPDSRLSEGMVSVTFDDGWQSVLNAVPLLDRYNIRSTQYIISDVADNKLREYMNFDTIRTLKAAGHEIGSHSLRHCNQTTLTPQVLQDNATKSKKILEDNKLGPVTSFAYPLGQYNDSTQAIYEPRFNYIRTSDAGYNDRYFDTTNIHSMGVLDTTTDEQFKAWLDYAQKGHQWVVLVYHRVNETGAYNVTLDKLERQLLMIQESKMKVLPLSEAADLAKQ
jgi:peptidoglycan/xylan/chitin deacetylase (PgdA/CDA1 family)